MKSILVLKSTYTDSLAYMFFKKPATPKPAHGLSVPAPGIFFNCRLCSNLSVVVETTRYILKSKQAKQKKNTERTVLDNNRGIWT